MSLSAGTQLGSFEIAGTLGTGGMGEVYRARDTKLGRDVAIKTLPSALADDRDRLERFEREAKLLAALSHAHIASIYSLDEHEGTLYLAMELVEGETLEEKLKAGALPVDDALPIAHQIAEALEAAHDKGVVHRDLKPANIMLTRDGVVKVLDFGLAKAFSGDATEASPANSPSLSLAMTQAGIILGTAGYMSPEQASGQATDQRSDVWGFGVVLYEMLTGLPPFSGESVPHILADVLRSEPDWSRLPKNLHPRLKLLLERCLEKKPRDRYHGIADARVDIEAILRDPEGAATVAALATPAGLRKWPVAAAFVAGLAVASLGGWMIRPGSEPHRVTRFAYDIPEDHLLQRGVNRKIVALSPDGRRFVYNTTDGLYLKELDVLEPQLVAGTDENLAGPFFSPDSQTIAYFAVSGELKRIAIGGGVPVVIADGLSGPRGGSWAADGTIFYAQEDGIYRVTASGGEPELIIAAQADERLDGPELLPGGDALLFSASPTRVIRDSEIVIESLSTGERRMLGRGGDAHYLSTGHLIYAVGDTLFATAFDIDSLTPSGVAAPMVRGLTPVPLNSSAAANYGIAENGTLAYFRGGFAGQSVSELVWVDREGHAESLGFEPCICLDPALSPDGTRLAVVEAPPFLEDADIWVRSLEGQGRARITFEPGLQVAPFWSSDSEQIAYKFIGQGIYARPANGTGMPKQLLPSLGADIWAWQEDGEVIYGENGDIGVVDTAGEPTRRPLLDSEFQENRAALSPDGHWLAYQSDETGRAEIYVRPYPDVEAGKWPISSSGGDYPEWSADGRSLFYLSPTSLMELAVKSEASFESPAPEALFDSREFLTTAGTSRQYAVAKDGRFLFARPADEAGGSEPKQIIVVENWVEELKRAVSSP